MRRLESFLKTGNRFLSDHEKIGALIFYILAVSIVYSPVVFFGKSFQSPIYHPNTLTQKGAFDYQGRRPFSAFNVDVSGATFGEFPVNKLVGDIYRSGQLPLWNPYKGVGEPIPEQLGSSVFFPYQILEDLSPVWAWDFFYLGRLIIAGFFSFLFLRSLKISKIGSLFGGLVYMLSGTFTWFINNEQMTNPAMMLPVVFWSLEGLLRNLSPRYLVFSIASLALILVSAPPGVTLYGLLLVFSFCLFRVISSSSFRGRKVLLLLFVLITAVSLTAPLLLPSLDFLKEALTLREGSGPAFVSPVSFGFVVFPGLSYFPVDYRFISNGLWDDVGSYLGVLPVFFVLAGLILIRRFGGHKGLFLFFTGFGVFVLLKNYGFLFFPLLGKLPLFNVVWSPRWSGPAWTFALSVAAVLSFETIRERLVDLASKVSGFRKGRSLVYLLTIAGLVALLAYFYRVIFNFVIGYGDKTFMIGSPPVSSWLFHFAASVTFLLTAAWLLFRPEGETKNRFLALFGLSILELWLWLPMGYQLIEIKLLPFALALLAVLAIASGSRKRALIFGSLFLISFNLIDHLSPFGLPSRYNPFSQPPYIDYLKNQEGFFRSIGTRGLLMPNFSSAYGLADIRHVSGSVVKSFYNFKKQILEVEEHPFWFMNTPFEPSPTDIKSFPLLCGRKEYSPARQKSILTERLPFYSLLGVKYILAPGHLGISDSFDVGKNDNFPLIYDREVKIYQNPNVLPRAFIAYRTAQAASYDKVLEELANFSLADLKGKVLLEEPIVPMPKLNLPFGSLFPSDLNDLPPKAGATSGSGTGDLGMGTAVIKSYSPNEVIVDARTSKAGVLVLTDQFYPGWQAWVNNTPAKIYRVDGLFRGVYLEPGDSQVVFTYQPPNFRLGFYLAVLAALNLAFLVYVLKADRFYLLPVVVLFSLFIIYYSSRGFWDYLENRAVIHGDPSLIVAKDNREKVLKERRRREMNFVSQRLIQLLPNLESQFLIDNFQFPRGQANPFYVDYRGADGRKNRILIQVVKEDDPEYSYDPELEPIVSFILREHTASQKFTLSSKLSSEEPIPIPIFLYADIRNRGVLRMLFFYWQKAGKILETRLYLTRAHFELENSQWNLKAGDPKSVGQFGLGDRFYFDCDTATWKKDNQL